MNKLVTSLKLSQQLKEAGFEVESNYGWVPQSTGGYGLYPGNYPKNSYNAYLTDELLGALPKYIWIKGEGERNLSIYPSTSYEEWFIRYGEDKHGLKTIRYKSLPEAAGQMVLWLIKEAHIKTR